MVFNEEKTIGKLLEYLGKLRNDYSIEIIVIDSGSHDNTIPIIIEKKKLISEIKYYSIHQKQFNYSNTRNKAVRIASGKYICFISGDALPISPNFIRFFESDLKLNKNIIAAYGQHIPYPHTPLFINTEILCRFDQLNKITNRDGLFIQSSDKKINSNNDPVFFLWYLSNVFACYKKSYLKSYPFPKTNYGAEDIMWAKMMIQKGYSIVYDSRCIVLHSHPLNIKEYFFRQKRDIKLREKYGNIRINILCKIKRSFISNTSIIKKILFFVDLVFCYLIKIVAQLYVSFNLKWKK